MARQFNGGTDRGQSSNFVVGTTTTVAFWLWWNAYGNDDLPAFAHTGCYAIPNRTGSLTGKFAIGMERQGGGIWEDGFTRPSAAAWHHYIIEYTFGSTPTNKVWVDGVLQTLTAGTHSGTTLSSALGSMFVMTFSSGRMSDFAMWIGTGFHLAGADIAALAAGTKRPSEISTSTRALYFPMITSANPDSTDPVSNYASTTITYTGTTYVDGPPFVMSDSGSTYVSSSMVIREGDDFPFMASESSMSGLDHYCNIIPKFGYNAQAHYDIGSEAAHSWELDDAPHFAFAAELNPEGNPC